MCNGDAQTKCKAYSGKEGLFNLWREAISMYRLTVIEGRIRYSRFCEDFIASHLFHNVSDIAIKTDHIVNICRIQSFLFKREDLVRKSSTKELTEENFLLCMNDFMLQDDNKNTHVDDFECHLNDNVINIITEAANDIHLFKQIVTKEIIRKMFNECETLEHVLISGNNETLSYFFSMLNYHSIISGKYQTIIEKKQLIKSSTGKRFLNRHDLSNALLNFLSTERPIRSKVDRWIVLIKKCTLVEE